MKKIIVPAIVALIAIFAASCSKSNTISNSWTFEGITYNTALSSAVSGNLNYTSTSPAGSLTCSFATVPTTGGPYTIINGNNAPSAGQIGFTLINSAGSTYHSTGSSVQTLSVTVSSAGKISVAIPNTVMSNGTDSSTVSGTVTQP